MGDTWIFNAGRQIGPVPCHIVIEADERRATWFSLAGNESVDLGEQQVRRVAVA